MNKFEDDSREIDVITQSVLDELDDLIYKTPIDEIPSLIDKIYKQYGIQ